MAATPKAKPDASAPALRGHLQDLAATQALGRALGHAARPGDCIALDGELGAGKTTLSRAIAEAFGMADPSEFASPTYTYVNPYAGSRHPIAHLDFYRVGDAESAYALGLEEVLGNKDGLVLVEWAKLLPKLVPQGALWLSLARLPGQGDRQWQAHGGSAWLQAALAAAAETTPS